MHIATFDDFQNEVKQLIDEYRSQCLWFLNDNFYPSEPSRLLSTLNYIEQHGNLKAFQRSRQLKQWLLQNSKKTS